MNENLKDDDQSPYLMVDKVIARTLGITAAEVLADLTSKEKYFRGHHALDANEMFYNSNNNIKHDTGLGRYQIEQAIIRLQANKILIVVRYTGNANYFKVNAAELKKFIRDHPSEYQNGTLLETRRPPFRKSEPNNNKGNKNKGMRIKSFKIEHSLSDAKSASLGKAPTSGGLAEETKDEVGSIAHQSGGAFTGCSNLSATDSAAPILLKASLYPSGEKPEVLPQLTAEPQGAVEHEGTAPGVSGADASSYTFDDLITEYARLDELKMERDAKVHEEVSAALAKAAEIKKRRQEGGN